ncbi:type IV secretion system DNA-binding domain-containing protein [Dickeya dadantii]|nr:type IV secretion system DNA-binding domain-containing protein [Dickeya dadantii]NPE55883.1 type IV secretion system DNA-binding domain-containing protein [Dickeya dadantii]
MIAAEKNKLVRVVKPKLKGFIELLPNTFDHPVLYISAIASFVFSVIAWIAVVKFSDPDFRGYKYDYRLRGSDIVSSERLNQITKDKKKRKQVTLATVKMPVDIENLQTLIVGATGSAKTLIITYAIYTIFLRGDRQIIVDPDGEFSSIFYKEGDVILNIYDKRFPGWSIFNEIRATYDFETYAFSLVPLGQSTQEEEWNGYGRLLVVEVSKKLHEMHDTVDFSQLYYWCLSAPEEELEGFCRGTRAESLFIGTERTLGSARFVLSSKLSAHLLVPPGGFSIRDWVESGKSGNIYITWVEDQLESIKPIISTFVDVVCNAILSMPKNKASNIWLHTDELASLDKIKALAPALTKGRKKQLRIISCLQAVSQLEEIWGQKGATTLRSCYRNLVVLGGARSDDITPETLSKALGEIEVVRSKESKTLSDRGGSTNTSEGHQGERIVTAAEISNLPDREGYVAFTRGYPIAKVKVPITQFKSRNDGFIPRDII